MTADGDPEPHPALRAARRTGLIDQVIEQLREQITGGVWPIGGRIPTEAELAQLPADERAEYLSELGLEEPGLDRLIRAGYHLLDLITYFTAGEKEVRAWTVPQGTPAPRAAGVIHTDFEKGFIRVETIAYDDFITLGGDRLLCCSPRFPTGLAGTAPRSWQG